MSVLTRKAGETIEIGGGVTVTVTAVGRKVVWFRAAVPLGVVVPRAPDPSGNSPYRP